jgi:hypothetical protein
VDAIRQGCQTMVRGTSSYGALNVSVTTRVVPKVRQIEANAPGPAMWYYGICVIL